MSLPLGNTGKGWNRWAQLPVQSRHSDLCNSKITNIFHFNVQLNIDVLWYASFPTLSWSDLQIPLMSLLVKM